LVTVTSTTRCRDGGAEVPLDPAREPGVAQSEVAELDAVAVVEELPAGGLVDQRPEATAQLQQNGRAEVAVLEDRDPGLLGPECPPVVVLQQVGQHAADVPVAEVARQLLVQHGVVDVAVQVPEQPQRRKRVGGPAARHGEDDRADVEDRHVSSACRPTAAKSSRRGLTSCKGYTRRV
jgi:hypothetical protein